MTVAVTGAGGTGVAKALLAALQQDDRIGHIELLVSANGRKLVAFEFQTAEDPDSVVRALEATSHKVRFLDPAGMSGPVTSGGCPTDAMIILPCAAGVLGRIAHGHTESLVERAADVMLKQRRKLVLSLREAPLNLIHLRNMVAATCATWLPSRRRGSGTAPTPPRDARMPEHGDGLEARAAARPAAATWWG